MVAGISGGGGAKGVCLPVPIPGIGLPSMGGGPGSLGGMARPPGPERDGGRLGKRPDFGPLNNDKLATSGCFMEVGLV